MYIIIIVAKYMLNAGNERFVLILKTNEPRKIERAF